MWVSLKVMYTKRFRILFRPRRRVDKTQYIEIEIIHRSAFTWTIDKFYWPDVNPQGIHIQTRTKFKTFKGLFPNFASNVGEFKRISSLLHPLILSDNRSFLDNRQQQLINLLKLFSHEKGNNTLWPLFMDGVQLPQGCGATYEEGVYFLSLRSEKFLVLIWSTLEGWQAELNWEPPSDFEHGTPSLGIQRLITRQKSLAQVFSCEFCDIFKNTFFDRTLLKAAADVSYLTTNISKWVERLSYKTCSKHIYQWLRIMFLSSSFDIWF